MIHICIPKYTSYLYLLIESKLLGYLGSSETKKLQLLFIAYEKHPE